VDAVAGFLEFGSTGEELFNHFRKRMILEGIATVVREIKVDALEAVVFEESIRVEFSAINAGAEGCALGLEELDIGESCFIVFKILQVFKGSGCDGRAEGFTFRVFTFVVFFDEGTGVGEVAFADEQAVSEGVEFW